MRTSISLRCPRCYECYEISEEIYDSFDQLKCNHCQYLNNKDTFESKKIDTAEIKKDKIENLNIKTNNILDETINKNKELENEDISTKIPVEKITLNTQEGNSSGEIIKNLIFMLTALAILSGFIFLMIRK